MLNSRHGQLSLVVIVGVALDQATKLWAETTLAGRGVVQVIDGYFDLRLSHNRGAFFSMGQHLPEAVRAGLFIVASIVAVTVMVRMLGKTPYTQHAQRWALMCLCTGAVGNMIDRARAGEVTDFLHLHLREIFHWATFNVADIFIAAGLLLLLLELFRSPKKPTS